MRLPAFLRVMLLLASLVLAVPASGQTEPPELCAPAGFAAEPLGVVVHLTWTETVGATAYHIYKMEAGSDEEFALAISMDAPANETFDTQVEGGVTYLYAAVAVVGGVETQPCVVVEATANSAPCAPALSAIAGDGPRVDLQWTAVAIADSYNVYRAEGDSDEMELIGTTDASTQAFTDTDVEAGLVYRYAVTMVEGGRERSPCNAVEVTTIPSFPTAFGLLAAAGLGVGAYAVMRRKR
ncbi:MAG: hypothetical protein QOD77_1553 [Thermoplasmata archaeon]|jgi:fibronectin type 3 domain-containing protein|nr:hypothetical protein [Thermoplasmata archaeon]